MFDSIVEPSVLIGILFLFSLLPLLFIVGTCFLKFSIILNLLRNAIGTQQVPPNMALYGLSMILTVFVMAPIGMQISENLRNNPIIIDTENSIIDFNERVLDPYKDFLVRFSSKDQIDFFKKIPAEIWPEKYKATINEKSFLVLLPAFTVTQMIEGFKIGFLLYLPFIAIDLIVSNILLAMGMMMVSPLTIALPFKLLIFILINGWEQLLDQLILSYNYTYTE